MPAKPTSLVTINNEKWCTRCKTMHHISAFRTDRHRPSGLTGACRSSLASAQKQRHVRKPRVHGRRFNPPRDGDKRQARHRISQMVRFGMLPIADSVACIDCGHIGPDRTHGYDHHLGYAAEHHESVEVVCTTCHHKRSTARGEWTHPAIYLPRGEQTSMAKLTEASVREIKQLLASGESRPALARRYGVSTAAVRLIAIGRNWSHVSTLSPPDDVTRRRDGE